MIKGATPAPAVAPVSAKKPNAIHRSEAGSQLVSPAHITVLLDEAVEALAIKPNGTYVDGTFGRGGHSRKILSSLGDQGRRLVAIDRDLAAIETGQIRSTMRDFRLRTLHFSDINQLASEITLYKSRWHFIGFRYFVSSN